MNYTGLQFYDSTKWKMKMKVLENVMIIQILEKFISKNFLNVKVISKNIQVFPKERFFLQSQQKRH